MVSEKSLAVQSSQIDLSSNYRDIEDFNFEKIYHFAPHSDVEIKKYRAAEFAIRDSVNLSGLKKIVTRSETEKETILFYLHEKGICKFDSIIVMADNNTFPNMLLKILLFINYVKTTDDYVKMQIKNLSSDYEIKCFIKYDSGSKESISFDNNFTCVINNTRYTESYSFSVEVNGKRMFAKKYVKQ